MRVRWLITASTLALLAFASMTAVAQDGEREGNDQGRGENKHDENRGQNKKRYREFNENQRQSARQYYDQHQKEEVFERNQWNNDYERRLRPGYVLDQGMRRMSHPPPYAMTRGLKPAPRGYRYVLVGGHLVLVDNGYRVHDAIHFEQNMER
jgi:Ni/Co efflux regulator RcnB